MGRDAVGKQTIDTAVDIRAHSSAPAGGSDRAFGFVFGAFFALVGLYPLIKSSPVRLWALGLAALFVVAALIRPRWLAPLNKLWTRLGLALNRVVSPVALFLVYCLAIVPTGLLLRAFRKDPLRLRIDPDAKTYWIERTPPGRADQQMNRQF
jgi:ABC-type branched-subunit amino acid transport system permease subunit